MSPLIKSPDSSDWDHYWKLQARGQKAYGFVANLYRKYIIKGTLNHHVLRHFSENSLILHAGSGSGEVDLDICQLMKVAHFILLHLMQFQKLVLIKFQNIMLRLIK